MSLGHQISGYLVLRNSLEVNVGEKGNENQSFDLNRRLSPEQVKAAGEKHKQPKSSVLPDVLEHEMPLIPCGFLMRTSTGRPVLQKSDGSLVWADQPEGEICFSHMGVRQG